MSQYKYTNSGSYGKLLKSAAISPLLLTGLCLTPALTLAPSHSAQAATSHTRSTSQANTHVYKVHFNSQQTLNKAASHTRLDWRNTEQTLSFNIPESHWIESIELMLSGTPIGNMGKHAPVFVNFNTSKTVPLNPGGQGFDARIKLNSAYFRTGRNQIKISRPSPSGYACMSESHGAWDINLKNSFVVVKARRKIRDYQIRDLKTILHHPDFSPKSVSLITKGSKALTLKALAAQAIALQTPTIPNFHIDKKRSDLEVIIGTRFELEDLISDPAILKSTGPRISMHEGRAARLVITGDTEAEVMDMMKAFGTYHLPNSRRTMVGRGEFTLQNPYSANKHMLGSRTDLTDLGNTSFSDSWGPTKQAFQFDVNDPTSSQGLLTLPLLKTADMSASSDVTIRLNGTPIARPELDTLKKTLTVDLTSQSLKPIGNILTIEPNLVSISQDPCGYKALTPGLFIEDNARIEMINSRPSPVTELSKFASNGAPFSIESGAQTNIVLTANTTPDLEASLKVLAHIARISGTSLVNADYTRLNTNSNSNFNINSGSQKHVLAIGPKTRAIRPILAGAPRSLTAALKGPALGQDRTIKTAELARYASANEKGVFAQSVARHVSTRPSQSMAEGGLIGLFVAPNSIGFLNGVISTAPGSSFTSSVNALIDMDHWNALSGSVARWNRYDVLSVQIANPVPGYKPSDFNTSGLKDNIFVAKLGRAFTELNAKASDFAFNLANRFENGKHPGGFQTVTVKSLPKAKTQVESLPRLQENNVGQEMTSKQEDAPLRITQVLPMKPSVHTPYIAPERRNTALRTDYSSETSSATIQTLSASLPRLRGRINTNIDTKIAHMRQSLTHSQRKFEDATSEFSLKREWSQTKFNIASQIANIKRKFTAGFPKQISQPVQIGMNKVSAQPGLVLILAFILIYIMLGLASPTSRLGKHR